MILTQEDIINKHAKLLKKARAYYKPTATACIVVTEENVDFLRTVISAKKNGKYDGVVMGTLDDVEYTKQVITIGTGIMFQIDKDGKLDAYPNPHILNPEKHVKNTTANPSVELLDLVGTELFNRLEMYDKIAVVKMVTVPTFMKIMKMELGFGIQASWGIQNDIEECDFIVIGDSNYKVDGVNNIPQDYKEVYDAREHVDMYP